MSASPTPEDPTPEDPTSASDLRVPGATTGWIDTPDGRLSVRRAGDSGPVVVLLSGAGIDSASLSWRHLIPALAVDHRVVAPDWPKQGGSRPWQGRADHRVLMDCLGRVLDDTGADQVDLVGLSMGGALTLAAAIEWPERLRRIVALAPAGGLAFPPVVHQLMWLSARSRLLNTVLPSRLLRTRAQWERMARSGLFAGHLPENEDVIGELMAEARRRGPEGVGSSDWQNASIGPWRMTIDLRPELHRITAPTLIIQGRRDPAVPVRRIRTMAELIPDARLVELADHGHWPNRQSPERINTMITDFLAGRSVVDPGPSSPPR